jgi:hypothetical protein
MPSHAESRRALATTGTLTEAARLLGVTHVAVSRWRQRQGLQPLRRGRRPCERVCAVHLEPQRVAGPDFDALWRDLGTNETAAVLNLSQAAVSLRALRRGLRPTVQRKDP